MNKEGFICKIVGKMMDIQIISQYLIFEMNKIQERLASKMKKNEPIFEITYSRHQGRYSDPIPRKLTFVGMSVFKAEGSDFESHKIKDIGQDNATLADHSIFFENMEQYNDWIDGKILTMELKSFFQRDAQSLTVHQMRIIKSIIRK